MRANAASGTTLAEQPAWLVASGGSAYTEPQLGALEYRIIIDCESESNQADLLVRLESMGLRCRALIS